MGKPGINRVGQDGPDGSAWLASYGVSAFAVHCDNHCDNERKALAAHIEA